MEHQEVDCCEVGRENKGILSGILLGLLPHSFCLAFIIFSVFGAVGAAAFLKNALIIPNFLLFLVAFSIVLATLSSILYLKQKNCLCLAGVKSKWKYVTSLYSAIIVVNLAMFFVIFPALANLDQGSKDVAGIAQENISTVTITTKIPCSGHAPLIIDEIKQNHEVYSVSFSMPNTFSITYDSKKTDPQQIISMGLLKTFNATIN